MRIDRIALATFLAFALSTTACDKGGDKKDDKKADKKDDAKKATEEPKAEEPKAEEPKPEAAAVETSPEMTNFLAKFDGTDAAVTAALKEFGANETISGDDMGMYMLSKPKVVSKDGDCYTFDAEAGITIRTYNVCWAEGKISKIEDKGMR
ncbi:hypothetical protein ACNOYE_33980 [Nannocystaceae bacterium ST9]